MTPAADVPLALRATAFIAPSRWLHRPRRRLRYDAWWGDGRVEFDVDLFALLRGRHTTDAGTIRENLHRHCPRAGTGPWINEAGSVIDGPAALA
ncbi:hypothetical protein [Arthrobacter sp. zg-Y750]|uniref:hypothetical protein n=1 Tax=Arthrobacter sp. zg-Y750 TaxID=2894189 RepID=UPI001E5800BD|nr:hypothetical protein [Arthrobacter sp. zg-Y750]MCC9178687.1 hypothetical protein [Arthrobacter sp. zg-Y750]